MSDRLDRYFALEAADYLDQLETHLRASGAPDLDQLLRLCSGVRGSAQMAGADSVTAVAERLEEGVRSVQGNQVVWSEEVRQLSLRTVADLKLLVRASSHWGHLDEDRVRSAIQRWESLRPPQQEPFASDWPSDDDDEPSPAERSAPKPEVVPEVDVERLFYDDAGPHVLTPEPGKQMNQPVATAVSEPVPIESLLLDRDGALREALAMRDELERAIRGVPGAEVELASTVRDLFELLEIAAEGVASRG